MTQEMETNEARMDELAAKHPYISKNLLSRAVAELMDDYGYEFDEVEKAFEEDFIGVFKTWEDCVQDIVENDMYGLSNQDWERVSAYFDYEKYGNDIKHDLIIITGYEGVAIFNHC